MLTFLEALVATDGRPAQHLAEEAREEGWSDEELLEAVAQVAMNEFQSLIANAAALPQDQTDSAACCRTRPSAAVGQPRLASLATRMSSPVDSKSSDSAVAWVRSHLAPFAYGPRSITLVRT